MGFCTIGIGIVTSFWGIFAARSLLGAAEGSVYPGMVRAFNDWMPKSERTRALAYAIPESVAVAVILGGSLASGIYSLSGEWQTMFFLLGVFSLLMTLCWYVIFRDDPADCPQVNEAKLALIHGKIPEQVTTKGPETTTNIGVRVLLTDPTMLSTYLAFFALGYFF